MKDILLLEKFNSWYDGIKEPSRFLLFMLFFCLPFSIGWTLLSSGNPVLGFILVFPAVYVCLTRIIRHMFILIIVCSLSACEKNETICYNLGVQRAKILYDIQTDISDKQQQRLMQALSQTDSLIISVCNCK